MLVFLLVLLVLIGLLALGWARLRAAARAAGRAAEAACPPLGRFREVAGPTGPLRLHYIDKGPTLQPPEGGGGRPPIFMIHGLAGSVRHFSATILDDLARDHRVIAADRPGMGYSDQPPGGPFGIQHQARSLDALLRALDCPPPLVIGHSLGGAVALALALQRPVAGLLLLAPATHPFKNKPPTPDQTIDSAFMRRLIAGAFGPQIVKSARRQSLETAFGPQEAPAEFDVAGGGILMRRPSQIETTMADGAFLRPALEAQSAHYAAIEAPITVLFGGEDRMLTAAEHIEPLAAKAPQTRSRILEGIGHMILFVEPDLVAAAAREMTGAPALDERD